MYHSYIKIDYKIFLEYYQEEFLIWKQKQNVFSFESIKSLDELGSVLGRIRKRLLVEGYIIKDGKIIPPTKNENN